MNRQLWIDHLISWKAFLNERISLTEDEGERIKCERQIKTIPFLGGWVFMLVDFVKFLMLRKEEK